MVSDYGIRMDLISRGTWVWLSVVMFLCYLCGLGLGLLTSALSRTEGAAIAALPLLILPQLLLSALAAGQINEQWTRDNRAFKPLALMLERQDPSAEGLSTGGRLVDSLSLLCYSRPGISLLQVWDEQLSIPRGYSNSKYILWLSDLCHLLILLMGTWTLVLVVFERAEKKWPRWIKEQLDG